MNRTPEQMVDDARREAYSHENFDHQTRDAMQERCDSQGHEWENCCSSFLSVYQQCRWCGVRR